MRVIIFFDLPVTTKLERREYARFRKFLIKNGFIMLQESVYSKLALNAVIAESIIRHVYQNKPYQGLVQLLILTERQFSRMEIITGEYQSEVLQSDKRLVIL